MRTLIFVVILFNSSLSYSQVSSDAIEKLRSEMNTRFDLIESSLTKSIDSTEIHALRKKVVSCIESEKLLMKNQEEANEENRKLQKQISSQKEDSIKVHSELKRNNESRKLQLQSIIGSIGQIGFDCPSSLLETIEKEIVSLESVGVDLRIEQGMLLDFMLKSKALKEGDVLLNKKLDSIDQIAIAIAKIQKDFQFQNDKFQRLNEQKKVILELLMGYESKLKRLCDIKELVVLKGMNAEDKKEVFNSLGINDRELLGYGFILSRIDAFMLNPNMDSTLEIQGFVCNN
jgi:hypothetical protein